MIQAERHFEPDYKLATIAGTMSAPEDIVSIFTNHFADVTIIQYPDGKINKTYINMLPSGHVENTMKNKQFKPAEKLN